MVDIVTKGKAGRPPKSIEQKQIEVLTPLGAFGIRST